MNYGADLDAQGFAIVPKVLDQVACEALRDLLGDADGAGTRGILRVPEVMSLAESLLADLVRPFLPAEPVPVRGIFFDKRPETN